MDQTPDLDQRLQPRLRDQRLRFLKKASVLLTRSESNPYSQKAVAQHVGVCIRTLHRWEQGASKPSLDQWDRWCAVLDLDFIELLTEARNAASAPS